MKFSDRSLTIVRTKPPLNDLVPKIQELALFFKLRCEHDLLPKEHIQMQGWVPIECKVLEHELLDQQVADAVKDIEKADQALESWKVDNVISTNPIRVKPFSRSTASLSAILERCDNAQEKLFVARRKDRYYGPPVIFNGSKPKDKRNEERPRSGTRGRKKRK